MQWKFMFMQIFLNFEGVIAYITFQQKPNYNNFMLHYSLTVNGFLKKVSLLHQTRSKDIAITWLLIPTSGFVFVDITIAKNSSI